MDYQSIYEKKKGSIEDVLGLIEDGDQIISSACANEPFNILSQLHTVLDKGVRDLRIYISLTTGEYKFINNPAYKGMMEIESVFFGRTNRLAGEDNGSLVPINLSDIPRKLAANRPPNVFFVSVTPMDEEGYLRTSLTNIYSYYYLHNVEKLIVEVNPNLPFVEGTMKVHISEVAGLVEVDTPVSKLPKSKISDEERKIGENVATLIDDGDTVQFGIGGIPDALADALAGHRDLGIHTEMINSTMGKLMRDGVVTNEKKTLYTGKTAAVFAWGDDELYKMMDRSDRFIILEGNHINDPRVIAQNDNMKSVNAAINVDLTGQIAAETIGYHQYSGAGGQFDTALGASWSKGGMSVIALRSTAKNDSVSTINMFLPLGTTVTLSRNIVDFIVTEYGIAPMRGRPIRDRAKALIEIAHPKFREQLLFEAKKCKYL